MLDQARRISTTLLTIAIFIALLALPVVFIKGSVWASEHLFQPLVTTGWIALALVLIVLLPLSAIRRFRGFTGSAIFLSSLLFGLIAWLLGFMLAYSIWGVWAVVAGLFLLGGGVVPIALLATLLNGMWVPFFALLVLAVITFAVRIGGILIAESGD